MEWNSFSTGYFKCDWMFYVLRCFITYLPVLSDFDGHWWRKTRSRWHAHWLLHLVVISLLLWTNVLCGRCRDESETQASFLLGNVSQWGAGKAQRFTQDNSFAVSSTTIGSRRAPLRYPGLKKHINTATRIMTVRWNSLEQLWFTGHNNRSFTIA